MGTYVIYTEGGGEISFTTGNDDFFNVGNGELISDLNSQDDGLKKLDVTTSINKIDDIQDGDGTLIGTIQAQNFNKSVLELDKNNLIKAQNVYLENQQKILKATAQSSIRNTQAILNSQDANTSMLNSLKKAVEDTAYANTLVQSQILEALQKIEEAITKKTTTINANGGVNVSLDTAPIVEALNTISSSQIETNQKIVEGINSQTAVNTKTLEKINQELLKDVEIDGVKYNSIDLEKNKNKEVFIGSKDENETLLNDGLELVEEALTDGFDVNINPLAILTDAFAEFVLQDKNELITKFNINDKGVV